jgi:hypothetical protein
VYLYYDTPSLRYKGRGTPRPLPRPGIIIYDDNPVYVIGHDHKRIDRHMGEMRRHLLPADRSDFPRCTEVHLILDYFTEYAGAMMGADRDKIRAARSIIVSL